MKTLSIPLLYLLLLQYTAQAQKIYFSDTTNKWRTSFTAAPDGPPGTTIVHDYRFEDTSAVLDGHTYQLLDYENGVWVRDDTQARKVYIKPLTGLQPTRLLPSDTAPFLYLDYNMGEGDTLAMPYVAMAGDSLSYHVVQAVDSVLINGVYHRTLQMNAYFPHYPWPTRYLVTEGIGTDTGPIFIPDGLGEWATRLVCFRNQGAVPFSAYSACSDPPMSFHGLRRGHDGFDIMPNPASGQVHIRYKGYNGPQMDGILLSPTGTRLREIAFSQTGSINLDGLAPGLYLIQVRESGLLLFNRKIIVR
ncbi:T9SS type A sorting domain-containing protein [Taibaiella helva]|uniref:hypothetical protein n=1 Tax=Taibaiella helva TaxID=2301235 RepID=UPI001300B45D|nr:hypothetical protein [Taibaiella helva]